MHCNTCPFYADDKIKGYAQDCAVELAGEYGNIAHQCFEFDNLIRPMKDGEPPCAGHQIWLKKRFK